MLQIIQNILDLKQEPREITPGNYVLGKIIKDNYYYELHYINNIDYSKSILIDDVWIINHDDILSHSFLEKKDIYICHSNIDIVDEVLNLEKEFLFFVPFQSISKYFYKIDDLSGEYSFILNKFNGFTVTSLPKVQQCNKMPVISIITTVYNNSKLLEQTIQSVINQSAPRGKFEYIIKDAGSTDSFCELIKKYEDNIDIIISEQDKGIYHGMQQGFDIANGKYLQILNSDDLLYNGDILHKYLNAIMNTEMDAYNSKILMQWPDRKNIRVPDLNLIYRESCINHPSLVIKRDVFYSLGGFDLNMKISADCDLTVKMVKNNISVEFIDGISNYYRCTGTSSAYSYEQFKEEIICRYRFHKLNILGYFFTIRRFASAMIKRIFIK